MLDSEKPEIILICKEDNIDQTCEKLPQIRTIKINTIELAITLSNKSQVKYIKEG
jgi:hypothetical protein